MSIIPNLRSSSTTFELETVKIRRPRRAQEHRVSAANSMTALGRGWRGLARLDWRKPVKVTLHYSGGSEPHVVVRARGREWAYAWDTALLDVLADVANRDSAGLYRKGVTP